MIGLNVAIQGVHDAIGLPTFVNNSLMKATNITATTYKIGLATTISPAEGSTFMTLPIIKPSDSELTFNLIINNVEKVIKANIATGLVSEVDERITIYPNPVKDNLTIDFGSLINCSVRITNVLGQTIYSSHINNQKEGINMTKFATRGLFYLQIFDNQNKLIYTKKILKK